MQFNKKPNSPWCEKCQVGLATYIWSCKSVRKGSKWLSRAHKKTTTTTHEIYVYNNLPSSREKTDELRGTLPHLDLMNSTMEFIYYLIFQGVHTYLKCHIHNGKQQTYLHFPIGYRMLDKWGCCHTSITYCKYTMRPIILMGFIVELRAEHTGVGQRPLSHVLPLMIFPLKGSALASKAATAYEAYSHGPHFLFVKEIH